MLENIFVWEGRFVLDVHSEMGVRCAMWYGIASGLHLQWSAMGVVCVNMHLELLEIQVPKVPGHFETYRGP